MGHDCCSSSVAGAVAGRASERGVHGSSPLTRSKMRRGAKASGWVLPGAVMILMPKCPVCVVAYVALVSGVGISVTEAAHLRLAMLVLCGAALIYVAVRSCSRIFAGLRD